MSLSGNEIRELLVDTCNELKKGGLKMIHFTFQLIPFAIGLGVGYLILVKSAQHEGILEVLGKFLGWILIVASLLVGLVSGYFSVKIIKTGHLPGYYRHHHHHEMMQQQEQNEERDQEEQSQTQEEIREHQKSH